MKRMKLLPAIAALLAILCRPEAAVTCAQQAMRIWFASVAPALFPFLALLPLLTGPDACAVYAAAFGSVMGPLFRLPGSAAPAMLIAMLSGSPGGAIATARIARQSGMNRGQLRRLAPAVCGVGPAYLVMGVGVGLYGSARLGLRLVAIQLCVQLISLLALRCLPDDETPLPRPDAAADEGGIRAAVAAVLSVCSYMVLFASVSGAVAALAGPAVGRALLLAADLPSGMAVLAGWHFNGRAAVLGIALGFGGLCIAAQNMDVLHPLGLRRLDFLIVKLAQAALTGVLCAFLLEDSCMPADLGLAASRPAYAFSLLAALLLCVPALIFLSKNLFLNKTDSRKVPS